MNIKEMAHGIQGYVAAVWQELHSDPELGYREFKTTELVSRELEKLGIPYRRTEPTGLIAELRGEKAAEGACIMLRADIDALPIQEETGLPFASRVPGAMHACGHDAHTSMLLGAARMLSELRATFAGTVRFVFQPAEELGSGAKSMIEQGAVDGVTAAMAMHVVSTIPENYLATRTGAVGAATGRFGLRIIGRGCHAAESGKGIDPIYAASVIVGELQAMPAREFSPFEPVVVSVCSIHGGSSFNVIPDCVEIEGTCRTFDPDVWSRLHEAIERTAVNTAAGLRCKAEVTFERIVEPLILDGRMCGILKDAALKITDSPAELVEAPLSMGAEDFSAYGAYVPLTWALLGAGSRYPLHSSRFYPREEVLERGSACYAQFALDALEQLN